jgi:hypothetical protein
MCPREIEAMRQEAKADAAALRSEVGQLRKAADAAARLAQEALAHSAEAAQQRRPPALPAGRLDSRVVSDFPPLYDEFRGKRFALMWRGSRDGFGARDFHGRCDGRANTLTLILDTGGNVFGGFTPLEWESREWTGDDVDKDNSRFKRDGSVKSFIFTLRNPRSTPARKSALKADRRQTAIFCDASSGTAFGMGDICVYDDCKAGSFSETGGFGHSYINDTRLDGERSSQVQEILQ